MSTTIPALRGKFGRVEYYLVAMSVGEFVRSVSFPHDIPGWENISIEDRYQRDLSIARIRKYIAPYYAMDEYRFSGALVVAVLTPDNGKMLFEPLTDISRSTGIPFAYKNSTQGMGFLTFQGGEVLFPLDGQHRAKAFKFAIDGTDENNRPIIGMTGNMQLAKDTVAVILVPFETVSARRIFSKINRYAKSTNTSENIITDDDDAMAIMTRELLRENGVINSRLVKLGGNTLNKIAPEFTTLTTFYYCTIAIVTDLGIAASGSPSEMPDDQRALITEEVADTWTNLLRGIALWHTAVLDPSQNGDAKRREIREQTLLGKPIGQLSLVRAFMMMRNRCQGVSEEEMCKRLNLINWDVNEPMWHGVLMNPNGRVMSGKGTVNRACEFIAHLAGAPLSEEERARLLEHIHGDRWESHELPTPVA